MAQSTGLEYLAAAIAKGGNDYAALKHEERLHARSKKEREEERALNRKDRLEDIASEQKFQRDLRGEERTFQGELRAKDQAHDKAMRESAYTQEEKMYNLRMFESVRLQLVEADILTPKEAMDPERVEQAMRDNPEFASRSRELAAYRTNIKALIDASEGRLKGEDLAVLMQMKPENIDAARALMSDAYKVIGEVVEKNVAERKDNLEMGAALFGVQMGQMARHDAEEGAIKREVKRLEGGKLSPQETKDIEAIARGKLKASTQKAFARGKPTPEHVAELNAEIAKGTTAFRQSRAFQVASQLDGVIDSKRSTAAAFSAIKDAVGLGMAKHLKGIKAQSSVPAAIAESEKAEPKDVGGSNDAANTFLSGNTTATPTPAPTPTPTPAAVQAAPVPTASAVPTPAVDTSSTMPAELRIAAEKPAWWSRDRDPAANQAAVKEFVASVPRAIADNTTAFAQRLNPQNFVPGYIAGVDSAYAFDPRRAADERNRALPRTLPDIGAAPPAVAVNPAERAAEDSILLRAPYSTRAYEIRRQRGMAPPPAGLDRPAYMGTVVPGALR